MFPGDLSRRDFEVELCLIDTIEGSAKEFLSTPAGANFAAVNLSEDELLGVDVDSDGDGRSNFFEFAFDVNGSATEPVPAYADEAKLINAQVTAEIDSATRLCELTIEKRPGVRESIEYFFESVDPSGVGTLIVPGDSDESDWTLAEDSSEIYRIVSKSPVVAGSAFYRAVARKNTFGVEITE